MSQAGAGTKHLRNLRHSWEWVVGGRGPVTSYHMLCIIPTNLAPGGGEPVKVLGCLACDVREETRPSNWLPSDFNPSGAPKKNTKIFRKFFSRARKT